MTEKNREYRREKRERLNKLSSYCDLIITISTILGIFANSMEDKNYKDKSSLVMNGISIGLLFISAVIRYQIKIKKDTTAYKVKVIIENIAKNECMAVLSTVLFTIVFAFLYPLAFYWCDKNNDVFNRLGMILLFASLTTICFIFTSIDIISFEDAKTEKYFLLIIFLATIFILTSSSPFWISAIALVTIICFCLIIIYLPFAIIKYFKDKKNS